VKEEQSGRLSVISELVRDSGLVLNLGGKSTGFGNVQVDIDSNCKPNIIASALCLPFKSNAFDQILFTDVIEHLPEGKENQALTEIWRVLKSRGILVLSTPNRRLIFMLMDVAWYFGHRHYTITQLLSLLETSGFAIERAFTRGYMIEAAGRLLFTNRLTASLSDQWFRKRISMEYSRDRDNGYTLFIIARKESPEDELK
jgi:ubiquinone/menaquinone biosynthesis C-methylase UbiE